MGVLSLVNLKFNGMSGMQGIKKAHPSRNAQKIRPPLTSHSRVCPRMEKGAPVFRGVGATHMSAYVVSEYGFNGWRVDGRRA